MRILLHNACCLLILTFTTVHCQIRTVNQIQNVSQMAELSNILDHNGRHFTTTLCGDTRTVTEDPPTLDKRVRNSIVKFYLGAGDAGYREVDNPTLRSLSHIIGLHDVIVLSGNLSIQEMETALLYAWMPSIETYSAGPYAPPNFKNQTAVRILSLDTDEYMTDARLPVIRITYTLAFSESEKNLGDPESRIMHLKHDPGILYGLALPPPFLLEQFPPEQSQTKTVITPMQRVPPPTEKDFSPRLAFKGLTVSPGQLVSIQSISFKGSPDEHDLGEVKRNLVEKIENYLARLYSQCDSSALDIQLGQATHRILLSEPRQSQLDWTHITYTINVSNKAYRGPKLPDFGDDNEPLENENHDSVNTNQDAGMTDDFDRRRNFSILVHPDALFRMHTSSPINFQFLSQIGKVIKNALETFNLENVFMYDVDADNGSFVSFALIAKPSGLVLDQRLNSETIYQQLEGVRVAVIDHHSRCHQCRVRDVTLHRLPVVQRLNESNPERERFLRDCRKGLIHFDWQRYDDCPIQEAFTLYLMTYDPKAQPMVPENVLQTVREAFSMANPLTVQSAYFNLTLTSHEIVLHTLMGHQGFRYNFSFTFSNLSRRKYWNVWKFPTEALVAKFTKATPSLTLFHPSFAFRLYSNIPTSAQFMPAVAYAVKEHLRYVQGFDVDDVVSVQTDCNNSAALSFFVVVNSPNYNDKESDRRFVISSQSSAAKPIHDKFAVVQNLDIKVKTTRNRVWSSYLETYLDRYEETPVYEPLPLRGREPLSAPTSETERNRSLEDCSQEKNLTIRACSMPKTFSLFLTQSSSLSATGRRKLKSADCLEAFGTALTQANPVLIQGAQLTLALVGRDDGFLTTRGEPVVQFEFSLTCSGVADTDSCDLWKFPPSEDLESQLSLIGAVTPSDPFY